MNRTWFTLNKQLLVGLLMGICALSLLSPGRADAQALAQSCGQWSIVSSPSPGTMDSLDGIAAISPQDVWTVGNYVGTQGYNQALIEHWNGTSWSILSSTAGTLSGVSVLSSNNVWVVGVDAAGNTLVEQWNGMQWSVINSPVLGQFPYELRSVSAVAANDIWAVGYYDTPPGDISLTLTEHWNGKKWSVVPSPHRPNTVSTLGAVSADSAANIWTAGLDINKHDFVYHTLIEHYC